MTNMVTVTYGQTGESQSINAMGMRTMQARAYDARNAQYLLVKSPPASGKSRALMFIALDKLENQGLRKVIVAVPERSIGASFRSTKLSEHGFFRDWNVDERWNLCNAGGNTGKVQAFQDFMASDDEVIVCTHATLRFAYERMGASAFEASVVAIDEFHHVSADSDSRLGEVVRGLMENGRPHIVAMTGSYFRGDALPVLRADDEEKFTRITYTYYEQLNGYRDLRSLGIGYHFYRGQYGEAIGEMLVPPIPKTIIHIPAVQSAAAYDDKYVQVDHILDHLGDFVEKNAETGIQTIHGKDGRLLKVADLVTEDGRDKVVMALRNVVSRDDIDIIIALGMAKEGFDWIWCEHALTVGYRGSLTEIIQIIGRATRDAPGKTHAQFTNLIAEPDATSEAVTGAVNNMLKAIACSLLMEQVLAPNFNFRTRREDDDITGARQTTDIIATGQADTIVIRGFHEPSSARTQQIVESDLTDLTAKIMQDPAILRASVSPEEFSPEVINQVLIPRVIEREYPDLTSEQVEEVRQHVVANSAFRGNAIEIVPPDQNPPDADGNPQPDVRFIRMAGSFINIDDLDVDLIDSINPFQRAYEILSKSVTADVLKRIHETITATRIAMSEEEAVMLWPRIKSFTQERAKEPSLTSPNPMEKRMAEALAFIREAARRKKAQTEAESA